jgi:hypothetical protein
LENSLGKAKKENRRRRRKFWKKIKGKAFSKIL